MQARARIRRRHGKEPISAAAIQCKLLASAFHGRQHLPSSTSHNCHSMRSAKGDAHRRTLTCARAPHRPAGPAAGEAPAQPAAPATALARQGSMWAAASPWGSTRAPLSALPEAAALAGTALPYPIPDSLSGPSTAAQPVAAGAAAAADADSGTRALAQPARRAAPSVHAPGRSASPVGATAQALVPVRVSTNVLELSMAAAHARQGPQP
jgi:hypothetical protein